MNQIESLEQASAIIQGLERQISTLRRQVANQNLDDIVARCEDLLNKSQRAQEWAQHAYRVDHYGCIWAWDIDRKIYTKTEMRVCTAQLADEAVTTDKLADRSIVSRLIADKAVTREKMTDQLIDDIRMVNLEDLAVGEYLAAALLNYYTKDETYDRDTIDRMLSELDVDVEIPENLATHDWVQDNYTIEDGDEDGEKNISMGDSSASFYTKAKVKALLKALRSFEYLIPPNGVLPTASSSTMGKIFLIPSGEQTEGEENWYIEYLTLKIDNEENPTYRWEPIGTTKVDLSGCLKTQDVGFSDNNDNTKVTINLGDKKQAVLKEHQSLSDYYKSSKIDDLLSAKASASALTDHAGNTAIHVSQTEKDKWNSMPTSAAVGDKADKVGTGHTDEIATLTEYGNLQASGKKTGDFVEKADSNKNGKIGVVTSDGKLSESDTTIGELVRSAEIGNVIADIPVESTGEGDDFRKGWNEIENLKNYLDTLYASASQLSGKQDKIKDLNTIIENAAAVANKVTKIAATKGNIVLFGEEGEVEDSNIHKNKIVQKSDTAGLLKNDGTVDTTIYEEKIPVLIGDDVNQSYYTSMNGSVPATLVAEADKYYRFNSLVNKLNIYLPVLSDTSRTSSIYFYLKTISDGSLIQFSCNGKTDHIKQFDSFDINDDETYEICAMWNGIDWILAYGIIE